LSIGLGVRVGPVAVGTGVRDGVRATIVDCASLVAFDSVRFAICVAITTVARVWVAICNCVANALISGVHWPPSLLLALFPQVVAC